MSFIEMRPYIKAGDTLSSEIQYIGHWIDKGVTVDSWDVEQIQAQEPIKLKVIDSIQVTREFIKNKVKSYNTDGKASFIYYDNGDAGFSFKVKCLISKYDTLPDDKTVYWYLNHFYTIGRRMNVVIDNEVIPNGVYTISSFENIDLIRKDYYEIEIEFTKHTILSSKLTNKCTILQTRLKACSFPSKKVTKKPYTVKQIDKANKSEQNKMVVGKCLQYVNEILYKKGLYGTGGKKSSKHYYKKYCLYWSSISKRALIRFQKRWNKQGLKPKLNTKGTLSKKTWEALKRYTELK